MAAVATHAGNRVVILSTNSTNFIAAGAAPSVEVPLRRTRRPLLARLVFLVANLAQERGRSARGARNSLAIAHLCRRFVFVNTIRVYRNTVGCHPRVLVCTRNGHGGLVTCEEVIMRVLLYVYRGNGVAKVACGDGWCNRSNRRVCLHAVGVKLDIQLRSLSSIPSKHLVEASTSVYGRPSRAFHHACATFTHPSVSTHACFDVHRSPSCSAKLAPRKIRCAVDRVQFKREPPC